MNDLWNLPHLALALIRTGAVLRTNPAFEALVARAGARELAGEPWARVLALDDPETAQTWWAEARGAGRPRALVTSARQGACWLRLRVHATAGGEDEEAVLQVEDATEERVELERMRREGAHFHALIERSAEGISIFDTQANILYESPSNKRLHGYEAHEMEGKNLFDFCHPDDMARVMPRFIHLAEGPGVVETEIVRFRHKLGHYIYLEGTVLNATDDPRVNGLVNNFRDVTARLDAERELRRAKEAAEQAQRLQQHFLANLSHELKTPLTLVRGPLADLAGDLIPPARRAETWGLVERNIERLDALITELIDLARLEAGAFSLRAQRRDLVDFARSQLAWFAELAESKRIATQLEAPAECPVFFDPAKLQKVLGNLLGNAFKFSPPGTTVRVVIRARETAEDAGQAEVEVRDEGPGMDEATRARVFERFFQGDAGLARGHEGMGIGMAIARELVEMHGGSIRVDSGPGAGSVFTFTLPLGCEHLDPDDIDTTATPEPRPHARGRPGTPSVIVADKAAADEAARPPLLLVEDNFDMRLYLRLHLDPHYLVQEAADGLEAWETLGKTRPALVLSDVMMPRLDGLELCRRLKGDPRLRAIPVVLLSAKGTADQRVEGLRAGADDYLAKPFSVSELLQRLKARLPAPIEPPDENGDDWVEGVLAFIDAHLGEADFEMERLARHMSYSSRQLRRRILGKLGKTPTTLLLERRLRRAHELIENRRFETLSEVAHAVGLSPGYFSLRYRQTYGDAKGACRY